MRDVGTLMKAHREFQVLLTRGSLLNRVRTGIGPEIFAWKTADGSYSGSPLTAEQEAYYQVTSDLRRSMPCKTTETAHRNTDTTHPLVTGITTSDQKFWNQTSSPGERLATRNIRTVLPVLSRISRSTCRSLLEVMLEPGILPNPMIFPASISPRAFGMPRC